MPHLKKLVLHGFKSFPRETEILLDRSMNCIVGPNGSGKSARWDTEVLLATGDKKHIGEIVEESLKKSKSNQKIDDGIVTKENPLGIKVLSINPITMKIEKSDIRAFIKRDGEPNLYTIKTKTGKEVTTTSCHPVMIYKDGKIVSEIVQNLKPGDFIATPNKIELPENSPLINITGLNEEQSNSEEFARFLGYIVGDGCIIQNSRIDFINADSEILEDYEKSVNFLGFKVSIASRKKTNAKNAYLYSKEFSNNLIEFFNYNYKKEKKHIPNEVLFGKDNILKNFLGALFDCDSSVRKDNPTFEYVTMSKELAENVILGLLRFGIIARKTKKIKYATNTKLKNKKEYFFITVEGKEKISQLYKNIPLKCVHKKELLKKWAENTSIPNTNNDLIPFEVNKEIKSIIEILGIKAKPLRKKYPFLMAYLENRCNASRTGLSKLISLFEEKLNTLILNYQNISLDQLNLVNCMKNLNISGQSTSSQIGVHKAVIMRDWATKKFNAKPENLEKFYSFIKSSLVLRIKTAEKLINIIKNLANSDIFWDKIDKINKTNGEDYVYDLEIKENHNFIANNIFVHNSNITDAICFVLGRLSIKSMRAAKAANMIFAGNKTVKPAPEASVSMVLDNSDKIFSIPEKEIIIRRTVRRNGQSIYKINSSVKTRQEVLEILAQAGIDPYGFNIILQGEIDGFVKMHSEDRRKIIEEVAGISVYETRKQKSLKELEKTDDRLKEVSAVLRERTSYLKNLENERQQALRFKKLELTVQRCKASILKKRLDGKEKEKSTIAEEVSKKNSNIDKIKINIGKVQEEIKNQNNRIEEINNKIQKSSGLEQGSLTTEIAELKAEIAGLTVRKDNSQSQIESIERRSEELKKNIKNSEKEIEEMRESKGKSRKTELINKKNLLEEVESKKNKFYSQKSSLNLLQERFEDKKSALQKIEQESAFVVERIEEFEASLEFKDSSKKNQELIAVLKKNLEESKTKQIESEKSILDMEKKIASSEMYIKELEKIKTKVGKIDICPLCKTKISSQHVGHIEKESNEKIEVLKKEIEEAVKKKNKNWDLKENLIIKIKEALEEIEKREKDILRLENINERKQSLRKLEEEKNKVAEELEKIKKDKSKLEKSVSQLNNIEEDYDSLKLEVDELSRHEEVDVGMEITLKQRELDRMKLIIKQSSREKDELEQDASEIEQELEEKELTVNEKEKQESALQEKFKKMFSEKNKIQDKIRFFESDLLKKQNDVRLIEDNVNNFKIKMAEINAQIEGISEEYKEFENIEILKLPIPQLQERLEKTQSTLSMVGTVNLRALEVYDSIKKEYDAIAEKVANLQKEKEDILKIIEEIDNKKRKTFNKTLKEINTLFSRNFSQLSAKGEAFLEPENKEDVFSGGLDIIIKVGKGKYFDVTSLSGGEQTLIALSLIFSIQEHSPYCFYIFDEIDAALDKRNSEKLSLLLKKHMKTGQYLIITHNDALISEASTLYGVSMQEGISKVLSLQI